MTILNRRIDSLRRALDRNAEARNSLRRYYEVLIAQDVEERVNAMKESDEWNLPDHSYDLVRRNICREWTGTVRAAARNLNWNRDRILAELEAAEAYSFFA